MQLQQTQVAAGVYVPHPALLHCFCVFDSSKEKGFPGLQEAQHSVEADNDGFGMTDGTVSVGITNVEYLYSVECRDCGGHEIH